MRILLTGSTGLIGQQVDAMLRRAGDVVRLGRRDTAEIKADLADTAALSAIELPSVDTLVHCAGVVDEDFKETPDRAMRMAWAGASALVNQARKAGATRLVYISSAHVYGPMVGRTDEDRSVNPASDYAIAHFVTEQVFRRAASQEVSVLALRPCAVFGALEDPEAFRRWSLIPFSFPRDAIMDGRIVIRSTGEQRRNFVGTQDIARAVADWLAAPAEGFRAQNPLGAFSASVHDFALICSRIATEITGRPVEVTRIPPMGRTPGDDFEFTSRHAAFGPQQSIEEYVRQLMAQLTGA